MPQQDTPAIVQNCPIEFRFVCDQSWDDLQPTNIENVRRCARCRKDVYLVSSDREIGWAIRTNKCVAWKLSENLLKEVEQSQFALGEPHQHLGELTGEVVRRVKNAGLRGG